MTSEHTDVATRVGSAIVADGMHSYPLRSHADATVGEIRELLRRDKVHVALLVDGARLIGVVEPFDLEGADSHARARDHGTLIDRTVRPGAGLEAERRSMIRRGRRRIAVVDADGTLVGLLCLKARQAGFCSDADVAARRSDPLHDPSGHPRFR